MPEKAPEQKKKTKQKNRAKDIEKSINNEGKAIEEAIEKNKATQQEVEKLLAQIQNQETKQTAIDNLIKNYKQQKDFSGFFKNKFKDILATDTKLALDILCDVSENQTLQNELFDLAKDDIKKMLHYGIHHHLFDQKEFIRKIYPILKSSSGELSAILDCISQNSKFKNFINELDVLIPKEDRNIMSIKSKLIILSIINHGVDIKDLIEKSYKEREIPLTELF